MAMKEKGKVLFDEECALSENTYYSLVIPAIYIHNNLNMITQNK